MEVSTAPLEIAETFNTLIPSRFPPVKLFSRLSDELHEELSDLESITNPRIRERERLLNGVRAVDVSSPLVQNWNHAPFAYDNPEGSRFFGSERPALELSDDLQTALAISVRKRERFLLRTCEASTDLDMRVLSRPVRGRFLDVRCWDPTLAQDERRERARSVLAGREDVDGLLFRPPERLTATCVAILNGATLDRAVQGEHFRFVWDGKRVRALYAFGNGVEISPEDLPSPESILAA